MENFINEMKKINGGQTDELEMIIDRLEDTDDGLKLLAACSVYAIDVYNIEENLESWYEEYFDWTKKKQEKLFSYMVAEAGNLPENEFMVDYFSEALTYLGVDFSEDALEEIITNMDNDNPPVLSDVLAE
ncbi:hypothetical protein [Dysgonomonas sp. 511]|uniref:hypothetical protein n=1 Tax=Dysgonomonas sp. 511 TaxID=2302930 RepID=UPI0013CF9ECE|nr:hypothetical protein [Dysgonomonas sp. 511]NDV78094.1 hypothetical protein [Dysgonomonas sp. 511]